MARPKVLLTLLTDADTRDGPVAEALLAYLFAHEAIRPEFVGNYEPIDNPAGDWRAATPFLAASGFLWKRRVRPVGSGHILHRSGYGSAAITIRALYTPTVAWLEIFRDLIGITNSRYGYLHVQTDPEWHASRLSTNDLNIFFLGAFAKQIENGLLELGWANYLDASWGGRFDPDGLRSEAALVEQRDHGTLFTTTDRLRDVVDDFAGFAERREAIRAAFARDVFKRSDQA